MAVDGKTASTKNYGKTALSGCGLRGAGGGTSATKKVSADVGFYTKNGLFHPLIPPPTTELKIR